MPYINAQLEEKVAYEEFEFDLFAWLEEKEFEPTPEMEQAARDAACYGQDDRVLCIAEQDATEDGTPIPPWAFN